MRYLSTIKKVGLLNFLRTIKIELRKKTFVTKERLLNKTSDKNSFSQYAEDLYIDRILNYKKNGVYIDIGANHPSILNNTKRFYDRGWNGINIEPDTINYSKFLDERPRDINLNIGISNNPGDFVFFIFKEDSLSTFSEKNAQKLVSNGYKIIEKKIVKTFKLSKIIADNNLAEIDFVSIDTEGYDQEVLNSNDWSKFRPRLICIEDSTGHSFNYFFKKISYKKLCYNGTNSFYIDKLKDEKN